MRDYEIVYIFRSNFTPEEIEAKLERFHAVITDGGGEITAAEQWGKRQLAYPIEKQTNGHYVVVQFTAAPGPLAELERLLKLDDDLLRFLVVLSEGELPVPDSMREGRDGPGHRGPKKEGPKDEEKDGDDEDEADDEDEEDEAEDDEAGEEDDDEDEDEEDEDEEDEDDEDDEDEDEDDDEEDVDEDDEDEDDEDEEDEDEDDDVSDASDEDTDEEKEA